MDAPRVWGRPVVLQLSWGARPEVAREHFERAIELSEGRDLSIKVEYARRYARLVFDQELHDRLLTDVLNAPAEAPGEWARDQTGVGLRLNRLNLNRLRSRLS